MQSFWGKMFTRLFFGKNAAESTPPPPTAPSSPINPDLTFSTPMSPPPEPSLIFNQDDTYMFWSPFEFDHYLDERNLRNVYAVVGPDGKQNGNRLVFDAVNKEEIQPGIYLTDERNFDRNVASNNLKYTNDQDQVVVHYAVAHPLCQVTGIDFDETSNTFRTYICEKVRLGQKMTAIYPGHFQRRLPFPAKIASVDSVGNVGRVGIRSD